MKVKINNKIIDAVECKTTFSKFRGLMFRKNPKALLFVFKKPTRQSIHSLFCKPFLAVWFIDGKITEKRIVKPFSLKIQPKNSYTELLEIPL